MKVKYNDKNKKWTFSEIESEVTVDGDNYVEAINNLYDHLMCQALNEFDAIIKRNTQSEDIE